MEQMKYGKLLAQINNTEITYEKQKTIHQLFEEQVYSDGNRIAAVYHNEKITYGQLNKKANQLAGLLRDSGAKPNTIIGLMVNRSLDMLIGMIAILKAGGCYLPIDPKFPTSRINHMLTDSGTKILLTQHSVQYIGMQADDYASQVIYLDDDIYHGSTKNLNNVNQSSDLAYVIYTSGSTGTPKGVMIEHLGVHNFILGMLDKIRFEKEKKIVSLTTISFDIFVLESLLPVTMGMEIVIANPMTFAQDMKDNRVQMLQTTPSTMQLILNDEKNYIYLDSLTDIMLGGEAFPQRLLNKLKEVTNARIFNMYGPTETTVWSMIKELTDTDFITVGFPIANTQIYLIDEEQNIMSVGQEGEICIGGDGLSRGYLNRTELTKERFIENKMFTNAIMYRTGDLGKWLENGEVEFLGRIDSQVKIRGFRIELGEIEAALQKLPKITDCVVAAKTDEDGNKYLVAYYVSEQYFIVSELISHLKTILPEYEVPGVYMKIDEVPLTPNGKINRLALPAPKLKRPNLSTEYIMPKTEKEIKIAVIWKMMLGYDTVGIKDNFFDLGGNSILVSKLHVELEKNYNIKFDIAELFIHNTISSQCLLLEKNTRKEDSQWNGIHLPEEYYKSGINCLLVAEVHAVMNELEQKKLVSFAKTLSITPEIVYLSLFMFLLSDRAAENEIEILCKKDASPDYNILRLDVSLFSDLQELCKKISEDYSHPSKTVKAESIKTLVFKDEYTAIAGYCYNHTEDCDDISKNEMVLEILETESETTVKMIFNSKKLNRKKISEFLNDYLQLIEAVTSELE